MKEASKDICLLMLSKLKGDLEENQEKITKMLSSELKYNTHALLHIAAFLS